MSVRAALLVRDCYGRGGGGGSTQAATIMIITILPMLDDDVDAEVPRCDKCDSECQS